MNRILPMLAVGAFLSGQRHPARRRPGLNRIKAESIRHAGLIARVRTDVATLSGKVASSDLSLAIQSTEEDQ